MVAEVIAELGIKFLHGLEGRPRLVLRHGARRTTARAATSRSGNLYLASSLGRQQRIAHARSIRIFNVANLDFLHTLKATHHDFHVGLHHCVAKAAKLFLVLVAHDLGILFLADVVILQEGRHFEKRAEEGVTLHPQLKVRALCGFARNIKAWQDENADVVVLDKLPVLGRDALPSDLGGFTGFPNEAAALV